jgi:hypothetical protein
MDFTNEINTLESEKLRLEEMLKRNNDRLQLLKKASTEPSSDGYRRFFKLKGYSLLYTGGERLNHERFIFNCTLVSTAGHLSHKYWNVEELSKKLEGAKEISKEEFIKWATEYQQRKINNINSDYTQLFKHINSIPDDGKEHLVSDLCGEQFCFNMFRTKAGRDAEKKQIVDLKPKCELKPFDKVLGRNEKDGVWEADLFSHYREESQYPFRCIGFSRKYCIPYEGNEHLLGTRNNPE